MTLANKVDQFIADADKIGQVANGDKNTVVQTGGGPVPSVSKLMADSAAAIVQGLAAFNLEKDKLHQVLNGDRNTMVDTDHGPVPSIAKLVADASTSIATDLIKARPYQSARDFPAGTLVTTSLSYAASEGAAWLMEIKGNTYGRQTPMHVLAQGYIYNNSMIQVGAHASTGQGIPGMVALNVGGKLCFWWPTQGYWLGYEVFVADVTGGPANMDNTVVSVTNSAKPAGTKEVAIPVRESKTQTKVLDEGVDLNTVTVAGFYRLGNAVLNLPGGGAQGYGQLIVAYGGADTIAQIYIDYVTATMYTRSGNPGAVGGTGAWTSWRTQVASHNVGTFAVDLASSQVVNGHKEFTSGVTPYYVRLNRSKTNYSGLEWYGGNYKSWISYMAMGGQQGVGPNGNVNAPAGTYVTGWALRSYIENKAGYGWTWESSPDSGSSNPDVVAEMTAGGSLRIAGDFYMGGVAYSLVTRGGALAINDLGNQTGGTLTMDYRTGNYQRVANGGGLTLAFGVGNNWPAAGRLGVLMLEVVNGAATPLSWSGVSWIKNDGTGDTTTNFTQAGYTLHAAGTDFVLIWTRDGGGSVYGKVMR